MKKFVPILLMLALFSGAISGCMSTSDGEQGIEALEAMTDVEYNKWKLYLQLGTKIGANRLLASETVTEGELELVATTLETVRDQSIVPGTTSILTSALDDAGLTNDEVALLVLIVEQELLTRGALEWIDPETGLVALSPRTKDLLTTIADAFRSATLVSDEEAQRGLELEAEFNGQIIS